MMFMVQCLAVSAFPLLLYAHQDFNKLMEWRSRSETWTNEVQVIIEKLSAEQEQQVATMALLDQLSGPFRCCFALCPPSKVFVDSLEGFRHFMFIVFFG